MILKFAWQPGICLALIYTQKMTKTLMLWYLIQRNIVRKDFFLFPKHPGCVIEARYLAYLAGLRPQIGCTLFLYMLAIKILNYGHNVGEKKSVVHAKFQ